MLSIGPSLFAQPTVRVDTPGVAFIRDNGSGRAAIEDVAGGAVSRRGWGEAELPEGRTPHAPSTQPIPKYSGSSSTSAPVHQGRRYGP